MIKRIYVNNNTNTRIYRVGIFKLMIFFQLIENTLNNIYRKNYNIKIINILSQHLATRSLRSIFPRFLIWIKVTCHSQKCQNIGYTILLVLLLYKKYSPHRLKNREYGINLIPQKSPYFNLRDKYTGHGLGLWMDTLKLNTTGCLSWNNILILL